MSIIKDKSILVIDDEAHIRNSIDSFLSDTGFIVLQAEDGRKGLDTFRNEQPDIILVDLRMPQVDGLDVLAEVTKESPNTPIIVVSGTGVLHDAVEALRLGAWDFITKPIYDMAVLEHSVEKALERAELLRENLRYKAFLEEEVRRRTAALEKKNEEFLKAKEEAEEANLAKSRFLTAMSHELRTPMNGVLGMAQLGLQTDLTLLQRKYFEIIVQSGQALLKILNEILDLSSIENQKTQIDEIEFCLEETIEGIIHLFSGSADTKSISLRCHIPVNIDTKLIGDPNRLNQILSNLLANALKFTDDGAIELTIDEDESHDETIWLRFGVSDTGIGISEEQLSLIFEPFTQVDDSATRRFSGTGLGLTIVKNLVELLRGTIWVESKVGSGSTFWLSLPFKKQEKAVPCCLLPDFEGAKLLIIDAQKPDSQFLEKQLVDWKLKVDIADSGKEGLEKLRTAAERDQPFDLMLVDYQLSDIHGVALVEQAISNHLISANRVVVTTAVDHEKVCESSEAVGAAACLPKPIIKLSTLWRNFSIILSHRVRTVKSEKAHGQRDKTAVSGSDNSLEARRRFLVVEDDQINRMVIVGMLEKLGYKVEIAENGKEALDRFQLGSFHLVFMDCLMPEMDGFEATKRIRELENSDHSKVRVPIIALTAKAMKGDREQCLNAGMDDYLAKPITSDDLIASINRYLK